MYDIASDQKNKEVQKYIAQKIPNLNVKTENSFKRKFCTILITLCCFFAVFLGIFFLLEYLFYDPVYSFELLSIQKKELVKNSFVNYNGVEVRFRELFPENNEVYDFLNSDQIKQIFNRKVLNFTIELSKLNSLTSFDWNNLNTNLKFKVLNSDTSFQGEQIAMNDLYEIHKDSFDSLSSDQIKYILNDWSIAVGSNINYDGNFHISRDFINGDIYAIFYKFKLYETKHDEVNFQMFYNNFTSLNDYNLKIREIKSNLNFQEQFYSNFDSFFANLLSFNSYKFNETQIIDKIEQSRIFILSGEAGVGKTSALEQIALIYKQKYPLKWISVVNLSKYKELFNISTNISNIQPSLEGILDLSSKNEFERKIFENSYKSGEIVLIWDEFDEILGANSKKILIEFMKNIYKNTKNIQLIGSRSSASKLLTKAFNTSAHSIVPFDELKVTQFLKLYFIFDHSYDKDKVNIDSILDILHDLSDNMKIQSDLSYPYFLETIADLSVKSPSIFESKNYFEIYSKIINGKVSKWIYKNDHVQFYSDEVFDAQLLYIFQKFALKVKIPSISNPLTPLYVKKLKVMSRNESNLISIEEYTKMGILNIKDKKNFKFVHKTFAKFFVVQFIVENMKYSNDVTSNELILIIQLLLDILNSKPENNRLIFKFFESYFKSNNDLEQYKLVFKIIEEKFSRILFNNLKTGNLRFFKLWMPFLKINNGTLCNMLQVNQNETLYTASFNPVYFNDVNGVKINRSELKNIVKQSIDLKSDDYERFLRGKDQKGVILYGLYYFKENYGVTLDYDDYGFDWVNDFKSKREHLINLLNSNVITSNLNNLTSNSGNITSNLNNRTSNFVDRTLKSKRSLNYDDQSASADNLTSNSVHITSNFGNNLITSNFVEKTQKLKRNINSDDQTSNFDNLTSKFTNLTSNSESYSNITSQVAALTIKLDPQSILKLVLSNLTESEQKQLFLSELSPIIDEQIILRKYFWEKAEEILSKDELKTLAVNILNRIQTISNLKGENFPNLLQKLNEYLSDTEIIEVMTSDNILHRSVTNSKFIKDLWDFFVNRTNEEQQEKILSETVTGECFGDHVIGQRCYDTPPLNIFYNALIFGSDKNIYNYFENIYNSSKALVTILNSNSVLPYSAMLCDKFKFDSFLSFVKANFANSHKGRRKILSFFYSNIDETNLSLEQYFDKISNNIRDNLRSVKLRSGFNEQTGFFYNGLYKAKNSK